MLDSSPDEDDDEVLDEGPEEEEDSEAGSGDLLDAADSAGGASADKSRLDRSSSGSARIAMRVPTLTPFVPVGAYITRDQMRQREDHLREWKRGRTVIFAITPSSCASTSI